MRIPPLAPTIEWGGLRLRGLRPEDAAGLLAYLSNPIVTEHTSIPPPSLEAVSGKIERCRRGYVEETSCTWALAERASDEVIGTCGYTSWSTDHGWAELSYDLAPARWGAGLMSQAVAAALRWAFDDAGFGRVHALVMTTNDRSTRLLERGRFTLEGTLRSYRIARGTPRDFRMYSLLRTEWEAASNGGVTTEG
ncbi:MAG TPA: GNAT family protein [Candidatus Polarisedimenticolia bacterium]|nr:GNAT family protein [Candidatus Polarisedimenticolia bacterium]